MQLLGVDAGILALTFAVATIVTAIELVTTKYPRTVAFILQSRWFYTYILIYGALGAGALALLPFAGSEVTMTGLGLNNPWVKAFLVGFSVKAVLHIRIFTVSTGPNQSFPVGLETFVQLFEPWMLKNLDLDHFSKERAFITPRATNYTNVADARAHAKNNIPSGFTGDEAAALESDIDRAATAAKVITAYLKYAGIKLTKEVFPI